MASLGRSFFGLATMASGVLQLVTGEFVRLVPKMPAWIPAPSAWAYLTGVVLVVTGLAILSGRMARTAASRRGRDDPRDGPRPVPALDGGESGHRPPFLRGFMWTNPLKSLALFGGAAILVGKDDRRRARALATGRDCIGRFAPVGALFLSVFLIVCGMQHFAYSDFVVLLVPSWIPPGQRFWTTSPAWR